MGSCGQDTTFSFFEREGSGGQWYYRPFCASGKSGCGYVGDAVQVADLTQDNSPIVSFAAQLNAHVDHLVWAREELDEEVEPAKAITCTRCGHDETWHWAAGSGHTTTACVKCMDERKATEWMNSDGTIRAGICDHTAEWVREPW